jgi:hypothetical protein
VREEKTDKKRKRRKVKEEEEEEERKMKRVGRKVKEYRKSRESERKKERERERERKVREKKERKKKERERSMHVVDSRTKLKVVWMTHSHMIPPLLMIPQFQDFLSSSHSFKAPFHARLRNYIYYKLKLSNHHITAA